MLVGRLQEILGDRVLQKKAQNVWELGINAQEHSGIYSSVWPPPDIPARANGEKMRIAMHCSQRSGILEAASTWHVFC